MMSAKMTTRVIAEDHMSQLEHIYNSKLVAK